MTVLAWIALAVWVWLLAMRGRFWLIEREPESPVPEKWPAVTAIVPARDEAATIAETVRSLRAQDYPGAFTVIVVDDQSSDGTADLAREAGTMVLSGAARPAGWTGKVWAMAQGVEALERVAPEAELILFTDADIRHTPDELRNMVARLVAHRLDLSSLMVRLATNTLAERAIVPAFVYFFRLLYPFRWAADLDNATAAAAGGYMLVRRDTLASVGGLAAIKGALIDDCALAAAIKGGGGHIHLALADRTESLRPYDWNGLWRMIARSAYTQLKYSPSLLAGTVLGMGVGFVIPPVLTFVPGPHEGPALIAWVLMALSYGQMLRFYRQSPLWAPLLPLIALFYLGATIDSALRHWRGRGGEWKGRVQAQGGAP